MLKIQTIVYPTDFSDTAQLAFQMACSLARDHGADLVLLYVAGPAAGTWNLLPDAAEAGHVILEKLNALQMSDPKVKMSPHIRQGEPAEEIVRQATESKADLIVMGTHGRTGLARLLAGSVAETVLRTAPCPVLAVRTPLAGK